MPVLPCACDCKHTPACIRCFAFHELARNTYDRLTREIGFARSTAVRHPMLAVECDAEQRVLADVRTWLIRWTGEPIPPDGMREAPTVTPHSSAARA